MDKIIEQELKLWAEEYHKKDFIANDPVQFPHRFTEKRDIEVSGLLTAIMSFGNRTQIIKKVNILHDKMGSSPYEYIMSQRWLDDFPADDTSSFYRMLSHSGMNHYMSILYNIYNEYYSLEEAMQDQEGLPMQRLCSLLGVSSKSPQKKLNMFLRWMIRRDSPVDFGLWESFSPSELIIPLDTHVCRVAHHLGLVQKATFSLTNAKAITSSLSLIFPGDPCLGDFALFGAGVNGVI